MTSSISFEKSRGSLLINFTHTFHKSDHASSSFFFIIFFYVWYFGCCLVGWLQCLYLVQPVKIIDPHLVSSFFDNYERAYLHTTTELENRSSWTAECSLTVQVTMELEDNICLVEHLQTQNLPVPANSRVQYTFPEVSNNIHCVMQSFVHCVSKSSTRSKDLIINCKSLDQQCWQYEAMYPISPPYSWVLRNALWQLWYKLVYVACLMFVLYRCV